MHRAVWCISPDTPENGKLMSWYLDPTGGHRCLAILVFTVGLAISVFK